MGGARGLRNLLALWDRSGLSLERRAVARILGGLELRREDMAEWTHFSTVGYQRVVIHRTPEFEVLLLCWRSRQRSPIHDHGGSTCGVRVIAGTATETTYTASPCGCLYPLRSRCLEAGSVCVNDDTDIHQVANLAPPGHDLITLHIYSPPLLATKTYSITETTLADHDRLATRRPRDLARPIWRDGSQPGYSNAPARASKVAR
jgi:cysteine dioxygenase